VPFQARAGSIAVASRRKAAATGAAAQTASSAIERPIPRRSAANPNARPRSSAAPRARKISTFVRNTRPRRNPIAAIQTARREASQRSSAASARSESSAPCVVSCEYGQT
jgi:hypothetical protein